MDMGAVLKWGVIVIVGFFALRWITGMGADYSGGPVASVWPGTPLGGGVMVYPSGVQNRWGTGPAWPYNQRVDWTRGQRGGRWPKPYRGGGR